MSNGRGNIICFVESFGFVYYKYITITRDTIKRQQYRCLSSRRFKPLNVKTTDLAQDKDKWRALVDMATNPRVSLHFGNLLSTISIYTEQTQQCFHAHFYYYSPTCFVCVRWPSSGT